MTGALRGRRILVTRRPDQARAIVAGLEALGAHVIEVPLLEVSAPDDPGPLDRTLRALDAYDWLAFTSRNAVDAVAKHLESLGSPALPPRLRVASVGASTSAAFGRAFPGRAVALEPEADYRAEGLLAAFAALAEAPRVVLLPVSDRARSVLADGLRRLGARVDAPVAYRTLTPPDLGPRLEAAIHAGVDLVALASPSAVQGLAAALGPRAAGLPAVVIGPTTRDAAVAAGLLVLDVAAPSTAEGLVEAARRALGAGAG
jgi:uroporphyrinogen-III synthase